MTEYPRVQITNRACELVDRLRDQHGELIFHQSGGCCDGSSPMCLKKGDLRIGAQDVLLGEVHGCPFYMSAAQFEYWKHTHLTIDVTEGRGSSFSLEIPLGLRFVTKSRLFTEEEAMALKPVRTGGAED
ncbi:MAG: DUF779 domain-containing protein [Rhodospirillales bacterium]